MTEESLERTKCHLFSSFYRPAFSLQGNPACGVLSTWGPQAQHLWTFPPDSTWKGFARLPSVYVDKLSLRLRWEDCVFQRGWTGNSRMEVPLPDLGSLRPVSREQPSERKEEKYATLWGNLESKAGGSYFLRFPRHVACVCKPGIVLGGSERQGPEWRPQRALQNEVREFWKERLGIFQSEEIGQAVVGLWTC